MMVITIRGGISGVTNLCLGSTVFLKLLECKLSFFYVKGAKKLRVGRPRAQKGKSARNIAKYSNSKRDFKWKHVKRVHFPESWKMNGSSQEVSTHLTNQDKKAIIASDFDPELIFFHFSRPPWNPTTQFYQCEDHLEITAPIRNPKSSEP